MNILRLSIPLKMELFDKIKNRLNGDFTCNIEETIPVKNNQGLFIVNITNCDSKPYFISLNIEKLRENKSVEYTIRTNIKQEKELYGVVRCTTIKIDGYFSFVLSDIKELDTASGYVLDRLDSVYRINDITNHLRVKDFNNEFHLVEFSVIFLNRLYLVNDDLVEEIKEKLNYFGYDEDNLPVDKDEVLLKIQNNYTTNWFKVSSNEFVDKLLEILILELYDKAVTKRFKYSEISEYISTLYGMYIYRLYYEHKKEL